MARPKNNLQVIDSIEGALPQGLEGDLNAINEHRHLIMEQFGEGLPYDRSRVVHETKFYMAQSAEAMLEAGKRLAILKECEPHGEFTRIVTDELGLSARTSRLIMQAAIKYSSPKLESKRQTFAVLDKTKLFELMAEDDEDLAELAEGGTIAGLTLDDVDRMSVRELRKALREKRDEYDVKCRVVAQKDAELNEMKEQKFRNIPADEEISQLRTSLQLMADSLVRETMGAITSGFERLDRDYDERGVPHAGFMAGLLLDFEREIQCLRTRFDLPETREPEVPEWVKPFTDDAQQTLPVDDDADNKQ